MHSRHSRCSAGVEPRCCARHPLKNPLPEPSPPGPASAAGSPSQASRPAAEPPPAPTHGATPSHCATCEAYSGLPQVQGTTCQCACCSEDAPKPSLGTTQDANPKFFSPFTVLLSLQMRSFYAVSTLGVTSDKISATPVLD